jgi:hypothetical protein
MHVLFVLERFHSFSGHWKHVLIEKLAKVVMLKKTYAINRLKKMTSKTFLMTYPFLICPVVGYLS